LDKAPDAFRTISEVADDLDIPQHVLRFWETRFTQIKPMKRSGGRRYYRPDDVDLLRGIRRLLYGEGYTIRGVQRILKEHGVKSVQGLVDGSVAVPAFGAAGDDAMRGQPDAGDDEPAVEIADEDEVADPPARRAPPSAPAMPGNASGPAAARGGARKLDIARLEAALQDLLACRQLLDGVMNEG
jgi:DNA-binding transcriptional MerR regulator